MDDFHGKTITVMGLGTWGGGAAVTRFLCRQGARVTVTDLKTERELVNSIASLLEFDVTFHLGGHEPTDFQRVDAVVANPAIPPESPFLKIARAHDVPILHEINLFFQNCRAPIIGVTGSNGKTTTATLIAQMLGETGRRVYLGGNIGNPLIEQARQMTPADIVVLELSSFQLEPLRQIRRSPDVAVVTNLHPNHLDHHGSLESYITAKHAILEFQNEKSAAILNADDPIISRWAEDCHGAVAFFSLDEEHEYGTAYLRDGRLILRHEGVEHTLAQTNELKVWGRFNIANLLAAALPAHLFGASIETIAKVTRTFSGLEHRLERFAVAGGVRFVNDSKSTTPTATQVALEAIPGNVVLLAGGYDKGLEPTDFARAIAERCRAALFIGATGEKLAGLTSHAGTKTRIQSVTYAPTLAEAVMMALQMAQPGDTVLLSPGHASWDQYETFEHRGREFKQLVLAALGIGEPQ